MSTEGEISDVLTNLTRPPTDATLTVRVIKSFEFRTERSLVLHDINLETTTVGELKEIALKDTLKLYSKAHGAKTTNLIINLDHDEWLFKDDCKLLIDLGFENETEVSFFNGEMYEKFKANPETRWDA
ncbi:hypothetical protein EYR40_001178 [Pleurotus pulmonarius]|nr:hypothetical protein EYR36_000479 [Pleurotus pulmonarius]KAF4603996.1 hypothetical protein EYR38_004418 [Pleurotus pulmonarius]KAF4608825.1 hypothetical protein EYR40_001178 [Pleurotus pulmonarius]